MSALANKPSRSHGTVWSAAKARPFICRTSPNAMRRRGAITTIAGNQCCRLCHSIHDRGPTDVPDHNRPCATELGHGPHPPLAGLDVTRTESPATSRDWPSRSSGGCLRRRARKSACLRRLAGGQGLQPVANLECADDIHDADNDQPDTGDQGQDRDRIERVDDQHTATDNDDHAREHLPAARG
jgi:hypothetical protein